MGGIRDDSEKPLLVQELALNVNTGRILDTREKHCPNSVRGRLEQTCKRSKLANLYAARDGA